MRPAVEINVPETISVTPKGGVAMSLGHLQIDVVDSANNALVGVPLMIVEKGQPSETHIAVQSGTNRNVPLATYSVLCMDPLLRKQLRTEVEFNKDGSQISMRLSEQWRQVVFRSKDHDGYDIDYGLVRCITSVGERIGHIGDDPIWLPVGPITIHSVSYGLQSSVEYVLTPGAKADTVDCHMVPK